MTPAHGGAGIPNLTPVRRETASAFRRQASASTAGSFWRCRRTALMPPTRRRRSTPLAEGTASTTSTRSNQCSESSPYRSARHPPVNRIEARAFARLAHHLDPCTAIDPSTAAFGVRAQRRSTCAPLTGSLTHRVAVHRRPQVAQPGSLLQMSILMARHARWERRLPTALPPGRLGGRGGPWSTAAPRCIAQSPKLVLAFFYLDC